MIGLRLGLLDLDLKSLKENKGGIDLNFDELLASYDPIDQKYRARFCDNDEGYQSGKVFIGRKMKASYASFIPNIEEVEKILLEPLRRILEVTL